MNKAVLQRIFKRGFTMPEIMVGMVLVAVLASIVIFVINPQQQLKKARDAKRKDDISLISQALGKYAVETGGYPKSTPNYQIENAPWGSSWTSYIIPVPKDPLPSQSYSYYSDGVFYQLYAELEIADPAGCQPCGPGGEYNWSAVSGNSSPATLPPPPSPTPSPTGSPIASPSPSPTPTNRVSGGFQAYISTQNQPQMRQLTIDPFDPEIGTTQSLQLSIRDAGGSPITQVTGIVRTDNGENTYTLTLTSGSNTDGVWSVSYRVSDSHERIYNMTFTASNQAGSTSRVDIQLEGSLQNLRGG